MNSTRAWSAHFYRWMSLNNYNGGLSQGWLAFELSVLRRLRFKSVALPISGEPQLGIALKRWGVRVAANDPERWSFVKATAHIENNTERLGEDEIRKLLEDAYVPGHRLRNPALREWLGETDAWWFDNVRANAEGLDTAALRALALTLGLETGDYALSFDDETRHLRQPLSRTLERLWRTQPQPFDNGQRNSAANTEARAFIAEQHSDLMFLRLPPVRNCPVEVRRIEWRNEWLGNGDGRNLTDRVPDRRTAAVATKQQFLHLIEEMLHTAAHLRLWAIAYTENSAIPISDVVECVNRVRRVETVYTKDFSEILGPRVSIITA